jgi:hypothetical protein
VEQINNSIFNPDALNNNFLTIAKEISDNIYRSTLNNNNESSKLIQYLYQTFNNPFPRIKFNNTTTKEIEKKLFHTNKQKSCGYGDISVKILKISTPCICSPLCYVLNKAAMPTGKFPSRLKYYIVKPIFKKGNTNNFANYRPIATFTSFSMVLEKLIYS